MLTKIRSFFVSHGISIERAVDDREIIALIKSLHPVQTSMPLIRIGGNGDGGYLIPDDLQDIAACFSPGVDVVASFEAELVRRGIPCFLADASVDQPPFVHPIVNFEKKYLGFSENEINLDYWVNNSVQKSGDLILQMDIEGAEWPVLLNVSDDVLKRFRILVIEFHNVDNIFHKNCFLIFKSVFNRLLKFFHVVHNHPNNDMNIVKKSDILVPRLLEMTFLRKDRSQKNGYSSVFPHPLDRASVPSKIDFALPPIWYQSSQT